MESVIVAIRIEKDILEKFDKICREQGTYITSEGLRRLVISAVKRGRLNDG